MATKLKFQKFIQRGQIYRGPAKMAPDLATYDWSFYISIKKKFFM